VKIAADDVLHLGEEIRIGDLQVVLAAVGLEDMLGEDALYGGPTDGCADRLGVFFEIAVSIAQRPLTDSREGRAFLAIHSDSHKARGFREKPWASAAWHVCQRAAFLRPEYPPIYGSGMSFSENGYGASGDAGHV